MLMMAMVVVSTLTFAQRGPRDGRQPGEERTERRRGSEKMVVLLELTDEQQQQIEDLKLAHLKATSATKDQLNIKRAELEAAISADKPVDKLIDQIGKYENQLLAERIKHRIAVRNTLNEEQKLKFDQFREGKEGHRRPHGFRGK